MVLSSITMAEDDISMNELEAAIQGLNATLKKFMEDEEIRHTEYMQSRSASISRMDRIEAKLVALQVDSAFNGGSNSSAQSLSNEPFHMLTTMIDVNHDEIDASKSLDVDISALNLSISYTEQMAVTPCTTDKLISSEAWFDAFPVVDASNLSGDQAFEQLIADYVEPNMLQGSLHSVVELDGCGKTKATFIVVDKQHHSSVVTDPRVSKLAIALTRPGISLSDPPDIVSVPSPPLALPWLHHSVYPQPWHSQYSFNIPGNNITNTTYGDSLYCVAIPQSNSQLLSFPTTVNFPSRYASNGSYPNFNCTVMVNHRLSSVPNLGWFLPEAKYNPFVSFHSHSSFHAMLKNNLTSDARIAVSKCLLALDSCYTKVSIIGDGVVFEYGTRKSIDATNIRTLFTTHYMFDEITLRGTCYFSNINWSLDFKQWDPGTIKAPRSGFPVTNLRVISLELNTFVDRNGELLHEPYAEFSHTSSENISYLVIPWSCDVWLLRAHFSTHKPYSRLSLPASYMVHDLSHVLHKDNSTFNSSLLLLQVASGIGSMILWHHILDVNAAIDHITTSLLYEVVLVVYTKTDLLFKVGRTMIYPDVVIIQRDRKIVNHYPQRTHTLLRPIQFLASIIAYLSTRSSILILIDVTDVPGESVFPHIEEVENVDRYEEPLSIMLWDINLSGVNNDDDTFALLEFVHILQLPNMALEAYQVHVLSYMNDPSNENALKIVGLISFSTTVVVVHVPEGHSLVMPLSLAFSTKSMMHDISLFHHLAACEMGPATTIFSDMTVIRSTAHMIIALACKGGKIEEYIFHYEGTNVYLPTLLSCCFVHTKGSSQFNQWDPGGCSLVH